MSQSEMGFRTAPFGFRREDVLDYLEVEADRRSALEEKLNKAEQEHTRILQEKDEADRAAQALIADRDRILKEDQAKDQTIVSLKAQVRQAQDETAKVREEMQALQDKLAQTQTALDNARADNASLISKCAEYDEARARLAEIELCAHGRAEEIQQRAEHDACSLVGEAEQMAERLLAAIEHTKESYRQALASAERESARANAQAAEALEQLDGIMTGLRGRLSGTTSAPQPTAKPEKTEKPVEKAEKKPEAKPAVHTEEKPKTTCPVREKPTLAQLLGALRGNK